MIEGKAVAVAHFLTLLLGWNSEMEKPISSSMLWSVEHLQALQIR